jgi:hypothetical protein
MHPAWEWASQPWLRHLSISYSSDNTIFDNRRLRAIVTSGLYEQLFWNEFQIDDSNVVEVRLASDQSAKIRLDTSLKGYSIASSVGGGVTGKHPDRIRIDDPHKASEAISSVKRDEVGSWFRNTISTRKARSPAIIITMQRLHEDDLCGRELPKGIYKHLLLPMRYEVYDKQTIEVDEDTKKQLGVWDCPCHASGPDTRDVRTKPGEILFPNLYDEQAVQELELDLGPFESSGQLQQRPTPISGGLFKRIWFEVVEAIPNGRITWARGWDTAASSDSGAYSVGTLIGRFLSGTHKGEFVINLNSEVREQAEDIDPYIIATAKLDGRRVKIREEKTPGLGKKIIADHTKKLAGYDYASDDGAVSGDSKVVRSKPLRVQCRAGNVMLYCTDVRLANDWLEEVCGFPLHKYLDRVDSASVGFNALTLEDRRKVKRARAVGGRRLRQAVRGMKR